MAKKQLWNDGWSFTELPVEEESYKFPANAFTKNFNFLLVANNNSVS